MFTYMRSNGIWQQSSWSASAGVGDWILLKFTSSSNGRKRIENLAQTNFSGLDFNLNPATY